MDNPNKNITGRDFIVFSVLSWFVETGSNSRNISLEIATSGNRVLYVDPPLDRITAYRQATDPNVQRKKEVLKGTRPSVRPLIDRKNIWLMDPVLTLESINFLPDGWIYEKLNRLNAKRLAANVQQAADALGFKNAIVLVDSDALRCCFIKDYLPCTTYLYYTRDFLQGVPYWQRHGRRLEPVHMAKATAVVANSEYLREWAAQHTDKAYYIGQGCNTTHFNPDKDWELPFDLPADNRPKIIYTGYLTSIRLDLDLMIGMAEARPDWDWVMVGPEDDAFASSKLHQLGNVLMLGKKNINIVPAYIYHSDVCINPQAHNEITKGNYPLKIDEYLAMGKPAVATRTEFMKAFGDHCLLADGVDEWISVIDHALQTDTKEQAQHRRTFAMSHSWENNVKEIYGVINQVEADGTNQ